MLCFMKNGVMALIGVGTKQGRRALAFRESRHRVAVGTLVVVEKARIECRCTRSSGMFRDLSGIRPFNAEKQDKSGAVRPNVLMAEVPHPRIASHRRLFCPQRSIRRAGIAERATLAGW